MGILFLRLGIGAVIGLPFYAILRFNYLRQKKKTYSIGREALMCFFVLFMMGLLVLVLWPGPQAGQSGGYIQQVQERLHTGRGINLVPFHTISGYFSGSIGTQFVINIVANVLMFSPLGFCLPLLWLRFHSWRRMFLIGIVLSTGIETTQLLVGRSVDIDDVILNAAGVMFGYAVFLLMAGFVPDMRLGKKVESD